MPLEQSRIFSLFNFFRSYLIIGEEFKLLSGTAKCGAWEFDVFIGFYFKNYRMNSLWDSFKFN